ncbi:Hint domain-containing protein [Propionibacterium freudenreichii]|uniref:Hint domain-containing protein n=1 Tax=Propionibacterium freudenreichii TaxID=1744 RepID=UPI00155D99DC
MDVICGGSPCFVAGTSVLTHDGLRPIEDVQVGDLVWTHAAAGSASPTRCAAPPRPSIPQRLLLHPRAPALAPRTAAAVEQHDPPLPPPPRRPRVG